MSNLLQNQVISFIAKNEEAILKKWIDRVIPSPEDPNKDKMLGNGKSMLRLIMLCLKDSNNEAELISLAYKVAEERLDAKVNIGDFVYNVSLGRSEIFNSLPKIGLTIEELDPFINKINFYFDHFLHLAVRRYTELKDKRIEEQSYFIEQTHKDRLTILGQMSSSFVHEFRNPLTSVMGFIKLLREKYGSLDYLEIIESELDQLKFRISQFLLTSKKEIKEKEKESIQFLSLVEGTLDFIYPLLVSTDVHIHTDIDGNPSFYGYADEFRQVMINIIINSLDALIESNQTQKQITITSRLEKNSLLVSITNNGPMIPAESLHSIFEPFFTTKKLGTGIGLYICRKIIEEHQGTLVCESNPELTSFQIVIPVNSKETKRE
ncbi:histidine kinase N-terminal domain-containing protein [Ammoniphilus sp. YIM 78166]|uniref:histidine kinase N-terminal domain-containing protein n=1 Tax=Ammoniphilus sp. YIM 78166 TaxID=1644106 RepID=UPI001F10229D|nr:histidine kinase N-terminal domain-containing protein [Ammoniphilus sp. YIM 78166]